MNYQKVYNQIVQRAKEEIRCKSKNGKYFEIHHIVPKCLGGDNSKDNLVLLTAREHFLCHWLLVRIYPENEKLAFAFWNMCNGFSSKNQSRYVITSRVYEEAKLIQANFRRKNCTLPNQTGKKTMYSKKEDRMVFVNPVDINLINEYISIGFVFGRKPHDKDVRDKISKTKTGVINSIEHTQNQKKSAIGRYTLKWFQDRHGKKLGLKKYNERSLKLSIGQINKNK